jgi:hypothetical protein
VLAFAFACVCVCVCVCVCINRALNQHVLGVHGDLAVVTIDDGGEGKDLVGARGLAGLIGLAELVELVGLGKSAGSA